MLDSGAFTAWTKVEQITVDEVSKSYEECLKYAHFFDKVWLVNLDVIPGAPRKQVDCAELDRAIEQSILNLEVLTTRFGNRVLGVFHQDEPLKYLDKLISLSSSSSCYLALSPRNDLPESVRVEWAKSITRRVPSNIKTHGLATMGVSMSRDVKWSSGDSAAWIQNSGSVWLTCSLRLGKRLSVKTGSSPTGSVTKQGSCPALKKRPLLPRFQNLV